MFPKTRLNEKVHACAIEYSFHKSSGVARKFFLWGAILGSTKKISRLTLKCSLEIFLTAEGGKITK